MTTNLARFTIDGDPASDAFGSRGYDAINGATGTFALETPTSEVWKVTFSVADSSDVNAPMASKDAPTLTLDNGAWATGTSVNASSVDGVVTTTWPASGQDSYIVRCKVNDGVNPDGSANSDYVFERLVAIRSGAGLRKIIGTEGTQYSPRGWADAQNELVEAYAAATMPVGSANQFITYSSGWIATSDIRLPNTDHRVIDVAPVTSGNGKNLTIAPGAGNPGEDDGVLYLKDGSGNILVTINSSGVGGTGLLGFHGQTASARATVNWYNTDTATLRALMSALVAKGIITGTEIVV